MEKYPLKTKASSAVFIFSVSDVIAQAYELQERERSSKGSSAAPNKSKTYRNTVKTEVDADLPIKYEATGNFLLKLANTWDSARTLKIAGFGCGITIWLHHWWSFLEVAVDRHLVSAVSCHYKNAATKVFIDQAIGAPIYNIEFFGSQGL